MKRVAVVAIPLALILVLVVRDGSTSPAQAAVKHALERTVDARSSRFTLSWSSPASAERPPGKIEGVMDYARHRGRISYFGEAEVIYDGDVMYMKWPLPWRKGPSWLRYDQGLDDLDPLDLQERALRNPVGLLQFLTGASSDVRELGEETVRDTRTVHYEGTLDLQRVVNQAPAAERAELQALLDFIREGVPPTVPFGLWVDGAGVAHRLRIDDGGGSSVLVEYYDFGIPVTITPPPPNEIMSHEDWFKELQAHATDSDCEDTDAGLDDSLGTDNGELTPEDEGSDTQLPESEGEGGMAWVGVDGEASAVTCLYSTDVGTSRSAP